MYLPNRQLLSQVSEAGMLVKIYKFLSPLVSGRKKSDDTSGLVSQSNWKTLVLLNQQLKERNSLIL